MPKPKLASLVSLSIAGTRLGWEDLNIPCHDMVQEPLVRAARLIWATMFIDIDSGSRKAVSSNSWMIATVPTWLSIFPSSLFGKPTQPNSFLPVQHCFILLSLWCYSCLPPVMPLIKKPQELLIAQPLGANFLPWHWESSPVLLTLNCDLYSSQTGPLMILELNPHICTLIPVLNPKLKSDPYFVKQLVFTPTSWNLFYSLN